VTCGCGPLSRVRDAPAGRVVAQVPLHQGECLALFVAQVLGEAVARGGRPDSERRTGVVTGPGRQLGQAVSDGVEQRLEVAMLDGHRAEDLPASGHTRIGGSRPGEAGQQLRPYTVVFADVMVGRWRTVGRCSGRWKTRDRASRLLSSEVRLRSSLRVPLDRDWKSAWTEVPVAA
jgi:hypothetical protein